MIMQAFEILRLVKGILGYGIFFRLVKGILGYGILAYLLRGTGIFAVVFFFFFFFFFFFLGYGIFRNFGI